MRKSVLVVWLLVLFAFALSIAVYPQMPEQIASHWNARGEVDGYMTNFWGLFLLPLLLAGVVLLFLTVPRIDPLRANIAAFRPYYGGFIVVFCLFMLLIHLQIILWNSGLEISPNLTLRIGCGLLFYYIGIMLEHAKRNWFIGIRTPWTLSSDTVWTQTHQRGANLFKLAGAIAILGVFVPAYAILFIIVPVLFVTVYTVAYSYWVYREEQRRGRR
ncbi:MAG TPA: SdpI family protein [Methanomicrobia archaeon]|nr:SdpI family protein [Methanomicrobia archaeon]